MQMSKVDYPTKQHLKDWENYRLRLQEKIKTEMRQLELSYFKYRLSRVEALLGSR